MIHKSVNRSFISITVIFTMLISMLNFSRAFAADERKDINECTINLAYTEFIVDGEGHYPKVSIKDGSYTLKKNTDYTTKYKGGKEAGTSHIYITGIGNYKGEAERTYEGKDPSNKGNSKNKKNQEIQGLSAPIISIKAYSLTSNISLRAKTDITGTISDSQNAVLKKDGNTFKFVAKKAGDYTVTFTAAENSEYNSATATVLFKVSDNTYDTKHVGLDLTAKSKGFDYQFKLNSKATKYKLYYREKGASKWKTKEISRSSAEKKYTNGEAKSPKYSVTGLKKKTKYQVKIKPYVNSKWINTKYWSDSNNKYMDYKTVTTK